MLKPFQVILFGKLATAKSQLTHNGVRCAMVWQGSAKYVVPLADLKRA